MTSSISATERKTKPLQRLAFAVRCKWNSVIHGSGPVALGAALDEFEEHLKSPAGWTESSDSPTKPRLMRIGRASEAAAVLAEDPHAPETLVSKMTAGNGVQRDAGVPQLRGSRPPPREFAPVQPLRSSRLLALHSAPVRPLRTRRSSMAWAGALITIILLPAVIGFLVIKQLLVPAFWEWQEDGRMFGLGTSSLQLMKNVPAQPSELEPRLVVNGSRGMIGEPVPLGLTLRGWADGGVVMIAGLLPGMSLSSGSAVGGNTWQVSATDLASTWIGPPQNFVGVVKLIAELDLPDATIAHRQSIDIEWIGAGPAQVSSPADSEQVPIAAGPAGPEQVSGAATLPKAVPAPQQLDQDEIAMEDSEYPPARNEQHVASSHEKRAGRSQGTRPTRNKETAKASARRRSRDEPFYADRQHDVRQPAHVKWQVIRHCWSVGQLVGSSSTSTPSCR
jgi:hypothetical protein